MVSQRVPIVWVPLRYHYLVSLVFEPLPSFWGFFPRIAPTGLAMLLRAFPLFEPVAQAGSYPRQQRLRNILADVCRCFRVMRELKVHEAQPPLASQGGIPHRPINIGLMHHYVQMRVTGFMPFCN
jgi:hypothetical protein